MSDEFEGFAPPEKNFFAMPNCWTDISANIESLAELKIIEYVIRHTWGFHEYGIAKTISHDEFMSGRKRRDGSRIDQGTKLSERSVKEGIKRAIKDGYLFCEVDISDKARTKKSYGLKMSPTFQGYNLPPYQMTGVQSTPQMGTIYPPQGEEVPPRGIESTHRSEKDTLEKHFEKNTMERESDAPHAQLLMSTEEERTLAETIGHDLGSAHHVTNCNNWRAAHDGASCEDYQAWIDGGGRETPTDPALPAVKPAIASTSSPTVRAGQSSPVPLSAADPPDAAGQGEQTTSVSEVAGAALSPSASAGAQLPAGAGPPKEQRKGVHLSAHETEIKAWYEELRGVEVSLSTRTVAALRALGKRPMSKDDFLNVTAILDDDPWFRQKKVGVDLYWIDYWWENKVIYLHGQQKPLADGPSSPGPIPPGWTAEDEARFVALQSRAKGV